MLEKLRSIDPVLLAGVMGSMLGLVYTKPLDRLRTIYTAIGGTGAAIFLTPAIASGLPESFVPAVSFLIGVFSMSIFGVVFQVIDKIRAAPIKTLSAITGIIIDVLLAVKGQGRRSTDKEGNEDE
jgi:hypothetical protein